MPVIKPLRSPMGWNSFDCFGRYTREEDVYRNMDEMAKRLKPLGYDTIVTDIGWYGKYHFENPDAKYPGERHASDVNLDAYGRYLPDATLFPSGIAAAAAYAHGLGLRFGVHLMRGVSRKAVELRLPVLGTDVTCDQIADRSSLCEWCHYNYGVDMSKPGAQAYYDSIIALLASWGVDFVKYDDITGYPREVQAVVSAMEKSEAPMMLSLSPGGDTKTAWMDQYQGAAMVRITEDIWDEPQGIERAFARLEEFYPYQREGMYLDLDMLCIGHLMLCRPRDQFEAADKNAFIGGQGLERMDRFTPAQRRTFLTIRAIAASPLMIGSDLPTMGEEAFALYANQAMIDCNQHTRRFWPVQVPGLTAWRSDAGYLALFNRSGQTVEADLPMEADVTRLEEGWSGQILKPCDHSVHVRVGAQDALLLRICKEEAVHA